MLAGGEEGGGREELLRGLRTGSERCVFERVARINGVAGSLRDDLAREVHIAFGGQMWFGEKLAWDVGEGGSVGF